MSSLQDEFNEINKPPIQKTLYKSDIETPVYSDLYITGQSYNNASGNKVKFTDVRIPSALMSVKQKKNIVFTKVNGANSEIVEYIGSENYRINVKILLTTGGFTYPDSLMQNIIIMLNCNRILKVNSWYLNQFGITDVIAGNIDSPQIDGWLFNQRIDFDLISVVPFQTQKNLPNNLPIF
jgi:hypothetical protein